MKRKTVITGTLFLLVSSLAAFSQGIEIRSVPVIAGNQSEIHPSLARGMGNLSIALEDPLGDPFVNPARTYRLGGVTLFSSPTRNSWSNEEGGPVSSTLGSSSYPGATINSIPFGGFFRSGNVFAGGLAAFQGYSARRSQPDSWWWRFAGNNTRNDIGNNTLLFGLFGIHFPESRVSIAASLSHADYGAIDGVNLLYPGSYDIKQEGSSTQYKVGVIGELTEQDQLEFVVARNLFRATHEVSYPSPRIFQEPLTPDMFRTEINLDETNSWVMRGGYVRSMGDGWKAGATITVNWKDHPKIPNYSLANIPRDPGTSIAYNFGLGAAQYGENTTWGFEYIYEPITSNTWAEAGEGFANPLGFPVPPTFKTVENFFEFSNHILRIGASTKTKLNWLEYRLGAQLHFYKYDLNQNDNLFRTSRFLREDWIETMLTGGVTLKFSNVQLLYTLQLILGNGIAGTVGAQVRPTRSFDAAVEAGKDFIVAPSGKLIVDKIPLITNQLTFVYRLE